MEYLDYRDSVKHYLQRGDNPKVQIAEPTGFDAANFVIRQEDKRYGRDVAFAPAEMTFSKDMSFRGLTHLFDSLIEDYNVDGFEAGWKYILEIEGVDYVIGELDFKDAKTDEFTYFRTKIIQDNKQELIKKREDIEVDLFSDEDLDGNPIEPLATTQIYLRATPEKQDSTWELYEPYYLYRGNPGGGGVFEVDFNPFPVIKKSEIEDTLSAPVNSLGDRNDFAIVEAANELTNVTLRIKGLNFKMEIDNFINNFGFAECAFIYKIGENADPFSGNPWVEIFSTGEMRQNTSHVFELTDQDYTIENLVIPRDQKLFLWFNFYLDTQNNPFTAQVWVDSGSVEVTATSTSISSIIETFNLGEAMQHVVKSISGLENDAPRFLGENAEFKDQYITNGLLMRNITDQPFYLSLKKILEYLPEVNGDYEVTDNDVFFGIYEDFYRNEKMASFLMPPNENFETSFNKRYTVNEFNFKYAKYEKGNDEDKSREGVHTEMQMLLPNKRVENSKDVGVGFVRDSFLGESMRKEAIKVEKDVATTDDETIVIYDVWKKNVPIEEEQQFTVYHRKDGIFLKLLNDNSINWELFGFKVLDIIRLGFKNAGAWLIMEITPDVLKLAPLFSWTNVFEGYGSVKIDYKVTKTLLTNRTNEGFSVIEGTTTPEGFSNMRFTQKRNTLNYWGKYLNTCCNYKQESEIKITKFIHNGKLETRLSGESSNTIEDAPIEANKLKSAILTPKLTKTTVICDFEQFWDLRTKIRMVRGYLDVEDTNGNIVSISPQEVDFKWADNLLDIIGEVKA